MPGLKRKWGAGRLQIPEKQMNDSMEGTNGYVANFAQFERSLNGGTHSWLHAIRKDALARFVQLGFPTTRDEEWRFTNVVPITRIPFTPADPQPDSLTISDISRFTVCEARCTQLVFLNGYYSETLSTVKFLPKGVQIVSLAAALKSNRELLEPLLAESPSRADAFASLNMAFMADGAFVYIPPGVALKDPIHLLFLSAGQTGPRFSVPRSIIAVGDNSQVSLVESYAGLDKGKYFTNSVTEVHIGSNCVVDHYRLQRESEDAFHVSALEVSQKRDSSYSSHLLSLGGSLVRSNIKVVLEGAGADCELNGLFVAKGRQHMDNHTTIDHAQANCSSRELYKGILDDASTGVFDGTIIVRKDAQKTNARQTNKNLLLSKDAGINTNPRLRILADDVKCAHGATIGQLNEEELFYLRSRGIERDAARTLLTYAFASELLGAVKIKPIQCQIDLVLLNRLSRAS
jgi:Fe-S cluster assembly protein SufD